MSPSGVAVPTDLCTKGTTMNDILIRAGVAHLSKRGEDDTPHDDQFMAGGIYQHAVLENRSDPLVTAAMLAAALAKLTRCQQILDRYEASRADTVDNAWTPSTKAADLIELDVRTLAELRRALGAHRS